MLIWWSFHLVHIPFRMTFSPQYPRLLFGILREDMCSSPPVICSVSGINLEFLWSTRSHASRCFQCLWLWWSIPTFVFGSDAFLVPVWCLCLLLLDYTAHTFLWCLCNFCRILNANFSALPPWECISSAFLS